MCIHNSAHQVSRSGPGQQVRKPTQDICIVKHTGIDSNVCLYKRRASPAVDHRRIREQTINFNIMSAICVDCISPCPSCDQKAKTPWPSWPQASYNDSKRIDHKELEADPCCLQVIDSAWLREVSTWDIDTDFHSMYLLVSAGHLRDLLFATKKLTE